MQWIGRKNHVLINLYMDQLDQLTAAVQEKIHALGKCIFCKNRLIDCDCNEPEFRTLGQKLSKASREEIDVLHSRHQYEFGNNDDYYGTCLIANRAWEKIYNEIRRNKKTARYRKKGIARAFATSFRRDKSTIDDVGNWLKNKFPNHSFALKKEALAWRGMPPESKKRLRSIYERAFKKGEKIQHGILKWIGWNWLCEKEGHVSKDGFGNPAQFQNGSCVYERGLFFKLV